VGSGSSTAPIDLSLDDGSALVFACSTTTPTRSRRPNGTRTRLPSAGGGPLVGGQIVERFRERHRQRDANELSIVSHLALFVSLAERSGGERTARQRGAIM